MYTTVHFSYTIIIIRDVKSVWSWRKIVESGIEFFM